MADLLITLDVGTTNTRAILWDGSKRPLARAKREVGVRNTAIDGNNLRLANAVHDCIMDVLTQQQKTPAEVNRVLASGMITSNMGLVEVPHLTAPAGVRELAQGIHKVCLPEVFPSPIWFVPGVKNAVDNIGLDNYETMDIMRGEETEVAAILAEYKDAATPQMIALPGSHSKYVQIDGQNRIAACLTTLSGELLDVITTHTILSGSLDKQFVRVEHYSKDLMLTGYRNAARAGFSRACFSSRILDLFANLTRQELASYLLGVCLQSDIQALQYSGALLNVPQGSIVVAGTGAYSVALGDVLQEERLFERVETYQASKDVSLAGKGLLYISDQIEA